MRVDDAKRQVWFKAGGVYPGQDPYYTHFCRVNLDGSGLHFSPKATAITRWNGPPGEKFFLDKWSRVDQPPMTELRNSDTGKLRVHA